ncbi:hypothetical protein MNBD_GAMMA12-1211 [hydrothermal vent metagenome]|uniref:Uncharacterized protein n=1 Tax=hydrothermal vent metagenome TaxID=652676 RepID=A0A3B0YJD6_9ZZZZ
MRLLFLLKASDKAEIFTRSIGGCDSDSMQADYILRDHYVLSKS